MSNPRQAVLALVVSLEALASGCTSTRTIARPLDPTAIAAAIFGGGGLIAGGILGAAIGDHPAVSLADLGSQDRLLLQSHSNH